jgi:hypothetical protein
MTDTDIAAAVEDFVDGRWARLSDVFVIATRVSAVRADRAEAIEAAAAMLRAAGVRFDMWDGEELDRLARHHQRVGLVLARRGATQQPVRVRLQPGDLRRCRAGQVPRRHHLLRVAAQHVQAHVRGDPVQPRPHRRTSLEGRPAVPGP